MSGSVVRGGRKRGRRSAVPLVCPWLLALLPLLLVVLSGAPTAHAQQMSPMDLNGGSCIAMAGRGCVAVGVDRRFGLGEQLVSSEARRVLKLSSRLLCAFVGLTTDVQTLMEDLTAEVSSYRLAEGRAMEPAVAASLLSGMLYSHRASPRYVEPIVAGLDRKGKPFICAQDMLGAMLKTDEFAVGGTSSQSLYGLCEAHYLPDLGPEELFETVSRCLLAALERDCLSGNGAVVHLVTADGVSCRELKCRMD